MPKGVRAMSVRSMREDWGTPRSVFDPLHAEFQFTLDAAATAENAMVPTHFTPEDDALTRDWSGRVWLNPPYGARNLDRWMQKAWRESSFCEVIVCLVPAYTGQPWWHRWVVGKASEIRWIKGKLRFVGAPSCATFPSCIVIYRPSRAAGEGKDHE